MLKITIDAENTDNPALDLKERGDKAVSHQIQHSSGG
jgi:hypothetical protein